MSDPRYRNLLVGVMGTILVGCGGGSSSSGSSSEDSNASQATLSGRAAVGAPIVAASVVARCADGSGFTNDVGTDGSGRFEGQVASAALPCALRVNGSTAETTLHSYAVVGGNVNITPLTDLIIAVATSASPSTWYDQSGQLPDAATLASAQASFLNALRSEGYGLPGEDFDPFRTPFSIGDNADQLLDNLMAAVSIMANVENYAAFVDLLSSGNLASIPQAPGASADAGTDDGDTGDGGGNGNVDQTGNATASACMGSLLDQEGNILELQQRQYDPVSGNQIGNVIDRQEVGGLVDFRGDTARVLVTETRSDYLGGQPLTLYGRRYLRLDQTAALVSVYGTESLDSFNGASTDTFWYEPSTVSRFDLAQGESYQQLYTSYVASGGGQPVVQSDNDLTTTYAGRETVTVPAGTFDTCKFYYEDSGSHGGWAAIAWVSVGNGIPVQGGGVGSDGAEFITERLQSFSLNGVQQAP
ncbi:hypothetical protein [Allohahella marinimesophila]|uniref:Uncharacterized protein n=1 Tax=Allohahella marinimesophila TaxID=1054972 RepID=A0ABP7NYM7_9GAMM